MSRLALSLGLVCLLAQSAFALTFDTELTVGKATFHVAVAKDPKSLAKGLMGVTRLAPTQGMLFLFEGEREATFWMKDTPLPLDLAFFTKSGEIVLLASLTPRARTPISSPTKVVGAIELPQGSFARHHVSLGDRVVSRAFTPS